MYLESSGITDTLDMQTPISTVLQQSDELMLAHRVAKGSELKSATEQTETDHSILITPVSVRLCCEWSGLGFGFKKVL